MSISVPIISTRDDRHAAEIMLGHPCKTGMEGLSPELIGSSPELFGDVQVKRKIYINKFNQLQNPKNPNEKEIQTLKELKRQACESISTCRSLNFRKILVLQAEINTSLFSKILLVLCKFSLFNDIFGSRSDVRKVCVNLENQRQLKSFDRHLLRMQNEILDRHAKITNQWRPRKNKVTKQSLLKRIKQQEVQKTLDQIISIYLNNKAHSLQLVTDPDPKDTIMKRLGSIKFSKFDLSEKEIMKLDENIELIVTGKNNYYLVFKDQIIGSGANKTVYTGLDLTKNRAIALGYASNELGEEETYCEITGKKLNKEREIIANRNNITKYIDYFEFKNSCIFVSELCDYDLKRYVESGEMKKYESVSLCKTAIDTILELWYNDVVFRDLKNLNFLIKIIDGQGHLKLADLDLNSWTPRIFPPEMFIDIDLYNQGQVDVEKYEEPQLVWTLGLLFYYIYFRTDLILGLLDEKTKKVVNAPQGSEKERMQALFQDLTDSDIKRFLPDQDLKKGLEEGHEPAPLDPFVEIIKEMLKVDPGKRLTLKQVQQRWAMAMKDLPQGSSMQDSLSKLDSPSKQDKNQLYHDLLGQASGDVQIPSSSTH